MAINTSHVLPKTSGIATANLDFSSRVTSTSESGFAFQSLFNTLNNKENLDVSRRTSGESQSGSSQIDDRLASPQREQETRSVAPNGEETAQHSQSKRAEQLDERSEAPDASARVDNGPKNPGQAEEQVTAGRQYSESDSNQLDENADVGKEIAANDGRNLPSVKPVEPQSLTNDSIDSLLDFRNLPFTMAVGEQTIDSPNTLATIESLITRLESQLNRLTPILSQAPNAAVTNTLPAETLGSLTEMNAAIGRLQQWFAQQAQPLGNSRQLMGQIVDPQTLLSSIREAIEPLSKTLGETDLNTTQTVSNSVSSLDSGLKRGDKTLLSELTNLMQVVREFRTALTNDVNSTGSGSAKIPGAADALMNSVSLNIPDELQPLASGQLATGQLSLDAKLGANVSRIAQSIGEVAATSAQQQAASTVSHRSAENISIANNGAATLQRMATSTLGTQSAWADEVQGNVKIMLARGLPSAELQLRPASLGALSIRIESAEEGSLVQFSVQSTVAKEQIEMHLPRLRELFAASQLELGDVSVSSEGSGQESDFEQQASSFLAEADSSENNQDQLGTVVESQLAISGTNPEGLLDVYA